MKKNYLKPTTEVVKIEQQCTMLLAGSVQATMNGTFVEEDLARELEL